MTHSGPQPWAQGINSRKLKFGQRPTSIQAGRAGGVGYMDRQEVMYLDR
jgi:hypothetical protein